MLVRVLIFYILTFVFTIVLGGAQEAANLSTETIILPQWGPGLAALVMLLIFRKDRFRITFFDRKVPASRYVLAALIPLGGAVLVYLIYRLFFGAPTSGAQTATPWILLLWFPLGAIGEELGWRGYLHKRLKSWLDRTDLFGHRGHIVGFVARGHVPKRGALHGVLCAPDDLVYLRDLCLGGANWLQCPGGRGLSYDDQRRQPIHLLDRHSGRIHDGQQPGVGGDCGWCRSDPEITVPDETWRR